MDSGKIPHLCSGLDTDSFMETSLLFLTFAALQGNWVRTNIVQRHSKYHVQGLSFIFFFGEQKLRIYRSFAIGLDR
jgi:hypothetical protein